MAWRFLTHLSEREVVDYCLYEIPEPEDPGEDGRPQSDENGDRQSEEIDENTALLAQTWPGTVHSARTALSTTGSNRRYQLMKSISRLTIVHDVDDDEDEDEDEDPTKPFVTLNALEIAAVADAKRFLSQHVVQKIITGIWNGDIIFWDSEHAPAYLLVLACLSPPLTVILTIQSIIVRADSRLGKTTTILQQSDR